jgi:hypothetical protein
LLGFHHHHHHEHSLLHPRLHHSLLWCASFGNKPSSFAPLASQVGLGVASSVLGKNTKTPQKVDWKSPAIPSSSLPPSPTFYPAPSPPSSSPW